MHVIKTTGLILLSVLILSCKRAGTSSPEDGLFVFSPDEVSAELVDTTRRASLRRVEGIVSDAKGIGAKSTEEGFRQNFAHDFQFNGMATREVFFILRELLDSVTLTVKDVKVLRFRGKSADRPEFADVLFEIEARRKEEVFEGKIVLQFETENFKVRRVSGFEVGGRREGGGVSLPVINFLRINGRKIAPDIIYKLDPEFPRVKGGLEVEVEGQWTKAGVLVGLTDIRKFGAVRVPAVVRSERRSGGKRYTAIRGQAVWEVREGWARFENPALNLAGEYLLTVVATNVSMDVERAEGELAVVKDMESAVRVVGIPAFFEGR